MLFEKIILTTKSYKENCINIIVIIILSKVNNYPMTYELYVFVSYRTSNLLHYNKIKQNRINLVIIIFVRNEYLMTCGRESTLYRRIPIISIKFQSISD